MIPALLILLSLTSLGCRSNESVQYASAGMTAAIGVAAAAVNRAATGDCWGACSPGFGCDEESGTCVPLDELEDDPPPPLADDEDDGCIVEDDGRRVCPDDPPSDVAQILALVIDLPALEPYYHPGEAPDRVPLRILETDAIVDQPVLTKFGEAVAYVQKTDAPHLAIERLEIDGDRAEVVFRYSVEGVVGAVSLARESGSWAVTRAELAER